MRQTDPRFFYISAVLGRTEKKLHTARISVRKMKKQILFLTVMTSLLLVSHNAQSQAFSAISPSGHTLYFWVSCDTCSSVRLINNANPNPYGYVDSSTTNAYLNYTGNLVIPATVSHNGCTYNVVEICNSCFRNCIGLTSVTIPSTIGYISYEAFENCIGLTTINYNASNCAIENTTWSGLYSDFVFSGCNNVTIINIGDDVRNISPYTFRYFKNLTTISIGKNVETFYWNALADTLNSLNTVNYNAKDMHVQGINSETVGLLEGRENSLTNLTIGNDVEKIPNSTFMDCTNLTSVVFNADSCGTASYSFNGCNNISTFAFGANVKIIPSRLCLGLSTLTSVTIPNSVRSIGMYAFERCTGLQSVTIGSSVKDMYGAFEDCTNITTVVIPDATTDISRAFNGCTGLHSVTIGSSVEQMGRTFSGCTHLTTINVRAEYPPTCNEGTFENVPAYADIIVPCGAKYRYEVTDYWKNFSRITEDCDGIEDVNTGDIRIWTENGRIHAEGTDGAPVNVFDMFGRNVRNENLPAGVYMVKVGTYPARKVVVIR